MGIEARNFQDQVDAAQESVDKIDDVVDNRVAVDGKEYASIVIREVDQFQDFIEQSGLEDNIKASFLGNVVDTLNVLYKNNIEQLALDLSSRMDSLKDDIADRLGISTQVESREVEAADLEWPSDSEGEKDRVENLIRSSRNLEEPEKAKVLGRISKIFDKEFSKRRDQISSGDISSADMDAIGVEMNYFAKSFRIGLEQALDAAADWGHMSDQEFQEFYTNLWFLTPLDRTASDLMNKKEEWRLSRIEEGILKTRNSETGNRFTPDEVKEYAERKAVQDTVSANRQTETLRGIANEEFVESGTLKEIALLAMPLDLDGAADMADILFAATAGRVDRNNAREHFESQGYTPEEVEMYVDLAGQPFNQVLAENWVGATMFIVSLIPGSAIMKKGTSKLGYLGRKLFSESKWLPDQQIADALEAYMGPVFKKLIKRVPVTELIPIIKNVLEKRFSDQLGKVGINVAVTGIENTAKAETVGNTLASVDEMGDDDDVS